MAPMLVAFMLSLGSSAPQQNDLRISIVRVESANAKPTDREFAITLENQSDRDFVVVLGAIIGRRLYPHAITLQLNDQNGRTNALRYRGPVRVGGRMDPYIVGLPRHASYVLQVSLAQFSATYAVEGRTPPFDAKLPPGSYTIKATLQAPAGNTSDVDGNRLINLWTGTVSSNVLRVSLAEPSQSANRPEESPEDRSTLIKALEDQAMLYRRHAIAVRRGEPPPALENPELLPQLASAVGELHDPASIPALAAALGSGFAAVRPLAAFGEQAVPAVLAVEASPESNAGTINHALITLRFIVENASVRGGLRETTLAQLRRVAARRLSSGKGLALTPLWWAIDLAWTLEDKDLREAVEALAGDPNVIIAKGVTDPGLVEQTQRRAAARVAGSPPLPRP